MFTLRMTVGGKILFEEKAHEAVLPECLDIMRRHLPYQVEQGDVNFTAERNGAIEASFFIKGRRANGRRDSQPAR
jgi:hypothetical protein